MNEKRFDLALSEAELVLLNNALNEILNGPEAIAEWEFETRTGTPRSAAFELLGRLTGIADLSARPR